MRRISVGAMLFGAVVIFGVAVPTKDSIAYNFFKCESGPIEAAVTTSGDISSVRCYNPNGDTWTGGVSPQCPPACRSQAGTGVVTATWAYQETTGSDYCTISNPEDATGPIACHNYRDGNDPALLQIGGALDPGDSFQASVRCDEGYLHELSGRDMCGGTYNPEFTAPETGVNVVNPLSLHQYVEGKVGDALTVA